MWNNLDESLQEIERACFEKVVKKYTNNVFLNPIVKAAEDQNFYY